MALFKFRTGGDDHATTNTTAPIRRCIARVRKASTLSGCGEGLA